MPIRPSGLGRPASHAIDVLQRNHSPFGSLLFRQRIAIDHPFPKRGLPFVDVRLRLPIQHKNRWHRAVATCFAQTGQGRSPFGRSPLPLQAAVNPPGSLMLLLRKPAPHQALCLHLLRRCLLLHPCGQGRGHEIHRQRRLHGGLLRLPQEAVAAAESDRPSPASALHPPSRQQGIPGHSPKQVLVRCRFRRPACAGPRRLGVRNPGRIRPRAQPQRAVVGPVPYWRAQDLGPGFPTSRHARVVQLGMRLRALGSIDPPGRGPNSRSPFHSRKGIGRP